MIHRYKKNRFSVAASFLMIPFTLAEMVVPVVLVIFIESYRPPFMACSRPFIFVVNSWLTLDHVACCIDIFVDEERTRV
jgi:hypothetical protein